MARKYFRWGKGSPKGGQFRSRGGGGGGSRRRVRLSTEARQELRLYRDIAAGALIGGALAGTPGAAVIGVSAAVSGARRLRKQNLAAIRGRK